MKTILMIALMWLAAPPTTQKQTIYKDGRNVGRVEIERDQCPCDRAGAPENERKEAKRGYQAIRQEREIHRADKRR